MKVILIASLVTVYGLLLTGCGNNASIPAGAELIWKGVVDTPDVWRDIHWKSDGYLYLVDVKSGNLVETRTIWKAKPAFTFNVDKHKEYELYFKPADIKPMTQQSP